MTRLPYDGDTASVHEAVHAVIRDYNENGKRPGREQLRTRVVHYHEDEVDDALDDLERQGEVYAVDGRYKVVARRIGRRPETGLFDEA